MDAAPDETRCGKQAQPGRRPDGVVGLLSRTHLMLTASRCYRGQRQGPWTSPRPVPWGDGSGSQAGWEAAVSPGIRLLTGRGPFDATSSRELLAAILRDEPRKLSELRPEVDPELEALVEAARSVFERAMTDLEDR